MDFLLNVLLFIFRATLFLTLMAWVFLVMAAAISGLSMWVGAFFAWIIFIFLLLVRLDFLIAIPAFIGATYAWEWHWAWSVLLVAPNVAFLVLGGFVALFFGFIEKLTSKK